MTDPRMLAARLYADDCKRRGAVMQGGFGFLSPAAQRPWLEFANAALGPPVSVECPRCAGRGMIPEPGMTCPNCQGRARVIRGSADEFCDHEFVQIEVIGRCLSVVACAHCGTERTVDSS